MEVDFFVHLYNYIINYIYEFHSFKNLVRQCIFPQVLSASTGAIFGAGCKEMTNTMTSH